MESKNTKSLLAVVRTGTKGRLSYFVLSVVLSVSACASVPQHQIASEKGVLNLEVGIDYTLGGIQPVARQDFYLVDQDFAKVLGTGRQIDLWQLTDLINGCGSEIIAKRKVLTDTIAKHTIAKSKTDLHGKLSFDPVPFGRYYVLGWSTVRKKEDLLIWNYPVDIVEKTQSLSLSSIDAATKAEMWDWGSLCP